MTAEGIALIVAASGAVITPITVAWIGSRAATKVEEVRTDLKDQGAAADTKLEAIHTAVNSERTAMVAKLEALYEEVQRLHSVIEQAAGHAQGIADQKQAERTAFKPPEP